MNLKETQTKSVNKGKAGKYSGKRSSSNVPSAWVQVSVLSLRGVTMWQFPNLTLPQYPLLLNGNNSDTHVIRSFSGLKEIVCVTGDLTPSSAQEMLSTTKQNNDMIHKSKRN